MAPKKISYYLLRLHRLGLRAAAQTLHRRAAHAIFLIRWRRKALQGKKPSDAFPKNFHTLCSKTFAEHLLPRVTDRSFAQYLPELYSSPTALLAKADAITNGRVELFERDFTMIDWGTAPFPSSWKTTFYADIRVAWSTDQHAPVQPDVKLAWEFARFNYLFTLGMAYQQALIPIREKSLQLKSVRGEEKFPSLGNFVSNHTDLFDRTGITHDTSRATRYAQTFQHSVTDWLEHNPYMIGITWKCPMDVAIRAINLTYGVTFFHAEPSIHDAFWKRLFCSLYDHIYYLEHNLELSDKPNNHLLADLLGIFFLTLFFKPILGAGQQDTKALGAFTKQLEHQLLPDGTAYEGSTAYHRLDTEMVLHALALCRAYGLDHAHLEEKFSAMTRFLDDCSIAPGVLVQIGDNDSGRIAGGISARVIRPFNAVRGDPLRQSSGHASIHCPLVVSDFAMQNRIEPCGQHSGRAECRVSIPLNGSQNKPLRTYPNFGLSIIRQDGWHITFRHPTFAPHQPTGHFHQDYLSITLALNGTPFIIDPGSYIYTPHGWARNSFRAIAKHNTFFLVDAVCDAVSLAAQDLFQLARKNRAQGEWKDCPHGSIHRPLILSVLQSKMYRRRRPALTTSGRDSVFAHPELRRTRREFCLGPRLREGDNKLSPISLRDHHNGYAHEHVRMERELAFDSIKQRININDSCMIMDPAVAKAMARRPETSSGRQGNFIESEKNKILHNQEICWMLHIAPQVLIQKVSETEWLLKDKLTDTGIQLTTSLPYKLISTTSSPAYATLVKSHALTTSMPLTDQCIATIEITKILNKD